MNDMLSLSAELCRKRKEANLAILNKFQELVSQDPGARFGQIVAWLGFGEDRYEEEPWDSLERIDTISWKWKVEE